MKRVYYVYVLKSLKDGMLYTGVTKDLVRRMREHQGGKTRSLRFQRPMVLVYSEAYPTRREATARERFFKTPEGGVLKQQLIAKALQVG